MPSGDAFVHSSQTPPSVWCWAGKPWMMSSMQNPGEGLPLAHTPQSESVRRVNCHPVTWNAVRTLSKGSFSFKGPLTDPGCHPFLHKIMYMFHLAADKEALLGEGTQTVLIAWVCVISGGLWLSGPSPLDITGQHVNGAPGCHSAPLTMSKPSSRALSAGQPPDFRTSV